MPAAKYTEDIDDQPANNYDYDAIGNLIQDTKEGISKITWTVYGKIESITKTDGTTIAYSYDATGNRITKAVTKGATTTTTAYVRDAQGNVLSIYSTDAAINSGHFTQSELHLYGSSRLGIYNLNKDLTIARPAAINLGSGNSGDFGIFERNKKLFELSNHLGNVLVTVSDKKIGHDAGNGTIDYYTADVVTATDYYSFGMMMPGRKYASGEYRYGFNGQEKTSEISGEGNHYQFKYREYDHRIGKFWSVDPLYAKYPWNSPYAFAENKVIQYVELEGLETGLSHFMYPHNYTGNAAINLKDKEYRQVWGQATALMTVAGIDMYLTRGWITRIVMGSQILGAFEHNRARTPEGQIAQDNRSKEALADAFITWGAGKILGASFDVGTSALKGLAKNRFNYSKEFYEGAGYSEQRILDHTKGIDLTQKIFETTLPKGTKLEQWTYLDNNGNPIMGDYYALPGADPTKLGIPLENRVKTTVVLTEDTKFLQSTAGDIENWLKPGEMLKGGETQLFQTNVKFEIKK